METPSVSSASRYTRLVQDYREKERAAESVSATAVEKAEAETDKASLEREKQQIISELSKRDQEVRTHEQAHASVGGRYASAPSYEMTEGPDGREYATGGHVNIDTSPVADDPEATLDKSQIVERAALAPAQPSDQDLKVASEARAMGNQARVDIRERDYLERTEALEETDETDEADSAEQDEETQLFADDGEEEQLPSAMYKEPKSFSFGLSFPQTFVGADEDKVAGLSPAQQLKDRFDTLGLSYVPMPTGQQIAVSA